MKKKPTYSTGPALPCGAAALFIGMLCGGALLNLMSPVIPAFYLVASIATFIVYAVDKTAAQANRHRMPENLLHLCSLAGGWPGALTAQALLRHKTRKQPFRALFWLTVTLNIGMLYWLLQAIGFL